MRCIPGIVVVLLVLGHLTAAAGAQPSAQRGAVVFEQQKCTSCHAISGSGEKNASPFERRPGEDYTPAGMASRMWNHAPAMWGAIRAAGLDIPRLTLAQSADLFALFYARQFFERPGDAARGKRVFLDQCGRCHSGRGPANPAATWQLPVDSVELVQRLWNHAPEMGRVLEAKRRDWPQLTSQNLTDLLDYVKTLTKNRSTGQSFSLPTGARGRALLESKGCTGCHVGYAALPGRLAGRTLTDVAASMWNHASVMREKAAELTLDDMREILAYLWSSDFFRSRGNVSDGRKVYDSRCGICHTNPVIAAPDLKKIDRNYTAITMVWALWNHGPKMLREVERQERVWPQLSESDMQHLIAFLDFRLKNIQRGGEPAGTRKSPG